MVGRHHHDHGGALVLGAAAALRAHLRAEVGGGHNHRHPTGDMFEDGFGQHVTLFVREQKLLREVGQNAQSVGAGVDHEIDATLLACKIEFAAFGKRGGHHGKYAFVADVFGLSHGYLSK